MRLRSFRSILDECLAAVQQGETVEACLARYPRHAARLKPLLALAGRVRRTPRMQPRPWAQSTAWNAVRLRAADLRSGKRRGAPIHVSFGWLKPVAVAFSLVLAIGATGGATAFASQDALPNETLYPVKLFTEDVRVWVTFDDSSRADLLLDQSDERMHEIATLVSHGDPIPENVLSALKDRNEDALAIIDDHPEETVLLDRARRQAESQERILVALWDQIDGDARNEYTRAVAQVHNSRLGGGADAAAVLHPEDLAGGIQTITGTIDAIDDGIWTIGGYEIRVDGRTIGALGIEPGSSARFIVGHSGGGRRYALSASLIQTGDSPTEAVVYGEVEEVTHDGFRMNGQWFNFDSESLPTVPIRRGQAVSIKVKKTDTGLIASQVSAGEAAAASGGTASSASGAGSTLLFEGIIEAAGDSASERWSIGGQSFVGTPRTLLDLTGGPAVEGARALVEAKWSGDRLMAQSITVLKSEVADGDVYLIGTFEGTRNSGLWIVSGLEMISSRAEPPEAGSLVAIDATEDEGELAITQVEVIRVPDDEALSRFKGTVLEIQDTTWNTGIGDVRVTSTAEVSGEPRRGTRAILWYGSHDGVLQAVYVRVLDDIPVLQTADEETEEGQ